MTREYTTEAIVMGSHKLGDADRVVSLFTELHGRVPVVVKGVRKVNSRFGGRLEPLTVLVVRLNRGRNLETLTAADTLATNAVIRDNPRGLQAGLSVLELLARTTTEHERRPRTWNLVRRFLPLLSAWVSGDNGSGEAVALTLGTQLKLLLVAGFLPQVTGCAACGATDTELPRFSAAAGGSLCPACSGPSFAIQPGSLAAMRSLLEQPLAQAAELDDNGSREEIRQAIREICQHHLGCNLKVEPWL